MVYQKEQTFLFEDDGQFPNNPKLPLLLYPQVMDNPEKVENLLHSHNWTNSWTGGVFDFHHFHSNTHEVLAVLRGKAAIIFGGKCGLKLRVAAGDVVIIPAGVSHKNAGSSDDFAVMGAYPNGFNYDLKTGKPEEHDENLKRIINVPLPDYDPIFGTDGPILDIWHEKY
ncbi:cupin domain-containing protein [Radiobacillus sp. PE A8.2]|uniref:cupin domain-containing protein n=1 Tax=Radiobacillus sp. PE A8.2 TaxID=3380349 RepID=UPI00388F05E9